MAIEYGRCPCRVERVEYDKRKVEVRMTVGGEVITLTDVPQGACPNCGSRVYKADVLARIESLMKEEPIDLTLKHFSV